MTFSITREIGIDLGHRIPTHGSKCWSIHGHRYRVLATVQGSELQTSGVESGMLVDFGFLHACMMQRIDAYFDHALCLWVNDPWLPKFCPDLDAIKEQVALDGWKYISADQQKGQTKLMVVDFIPTAENLAKCWHGMLVGGVRQLSMSKAFLQQVEVFETPNCSSKYPSTMMTLPDSTFTPIFKT